MKEYTRPKWISLPIKSEMDFDMLAQMKLSMLRRGINTRTAYIRALVWEDSKRNKGGKS